jgi:transcriptional activator of cad operon
MDRTTETALRIGDWSVDPATNQIAREGQTVRLEARTMRLLLCLAEHPGETVSTDELMDRVWSGTIVTQDSVYQAVASLRRVLGDDPKKPAYIATVPRRGYRMVARVLAQSDSSIVAAAAPARTGALLRARYRKAGLLLGMGALVAVALGLTFSNLSSVTKDGRAISPAQATPHAQSVAVLPFLDLTSEAMNEEYFADGMTEELIDRLSKIPGVQVSPPTASFYFKGKQMPVGAIARALNVTFVMEGSVRKSGPTLRVAARLVRADDGLIIWSQTYDRESGDLLRVQDEIAGQVAQALEESRALKAR